jgi:hypothetical protein
MAEQIIPVTSEHGPLWPKTERRTSLRFVVTPENGCQPVAAFLPEHPEVGWFGQLRNISLGGAGLLLTRAFGAGTLLMLQLSDPVQGTPHTFPVRVIHARRDGTRGWLVGCEFISPLREEELRALVGE